MHEHEPPLVDALVVQARSGRGPAWWRVSRGDSTVWILGTPPYGATWLNWNSSEFHKRLDGAKAFLAPVELWPLPGPTSPRLLAEHDKIGRPGMRLGDLPAGLSGGIAAAVAQYTGQQADMNWGIVYTSRLLTTRVFTEAGLQQRSLKLELTMIALEKQIPVRNLNIDTAKPVAAWMDTARDAQLQCLINVMGDAAAGPEPVQVALRAWSVGDLPNALATAGCTGAKIPIYPLVADATAKVIKGYLEQPGVAVAGVELVPLLMRGGVIEQLMVAGYRVETPDVLRPI